MCGGDTPNLLIVHGGKENAAFALVEEVMGWFGIPAITITATTVENEEMEVILENLFRETTTTALIVRHADQILSRMPHFFSLLDSAHREHVDAEEGCAAATTTLPFTMTAIKKHFVCLLCEGVEEPSPLITARSRHPVLSCGNPDQADRVTFTKHTVQRITEAYPIVPSRFMDYDVMSSWMVGLSYSDIDNILYTCVQKLLQTCEESESPPSPVSYQYVLTMDVCQEVLNVYIKSHGYSVVSTKLQPVRWSDVGGLEDAKRELKEAIQLPTLYPELFARSGMKKRSGILFYGPPGCGKTLLAKAVATEMNMNFMSVKGPELINQYVGESEKQIRQLFQKARDNAPCIIFFDELDALAPARGAKGDGGGAMDRIVAQLLVEVDGVGQPSTTASCSSGGSASPTLFIIGATNRPDLLDSALLRPGRFDRLCYLGIPSTKEEQLYAVRALTRKFSLDADVDLRAIVDQMDFVYTGADFFALCSDAMMLAVQEKLDEAKADLGATQQQRTDLANDEGSPNTDAEKDAFTVSMKHFRKSLDQLKPSVSPDDLKRYELLRKKFSS
ncbi:peroxisome assembly protein [Strigomonas culicis]|uniref:Peroxisomal ATPase PEX6 n=1 Tax=Strigomonas culicis TaxID=28005 RepID=S9U080_9TRYP|nr:peroxisome assembly protein [Strigomonas culicis]|eukprot:EPY22269.1 peroxisome assembly protein [Strigomonas culicis]